MNINNPDELADTNEVPKIEDPPEPKEEETSAKTIPSGASYPVDYVMSVKLKVDKGSDIPLYDQRIELTNWPSAWVPPDFKRIEGKEFDSSKEDYWLFCVHLHDAEMDFAIHGKEVAHATSHPNWHNYKDTTEKRVGYMSKKSFDMGRMWRIHASWAEFDLEDNRYVAIRAPKMSNPAITVTGYGSLATLSWVGLFVKHSADNMNEFIAVKTSCRLLPEYAKDIKDRAGSEWPIWGADVTSKSITLFPKQLYGTRGNNQETYDKFVTASPTFQPVPPPKSPPKPHDTPIQHLDAVVARLGHSLGRKHFELVASKCRQGKMNDITQKGFSYTWNSYTDTYIARVHQMGPREEWGHQERENFDYCKGISIKATEVDGLKMLLGLFGSLVKVISSLVRADFVGVLENLIETGEKVTEKTINSDVKGTITAVAEVVRAIWEKKRDDKKVTDEEFEKAVLVIDMVNRGNIQDLMAKDAMGILEDSDFGLG
ncbi:hypothetical protein N7524_011173 [Penicillium chrysogenum]|nr:hypothetical protein N7524_011173 [Penicillium chrysogenum]